MTFKKIFAGVLASAISFTAGIVPNISMLFMQTELTASAETEGTYENLTYTAYDDYVEITDCDDSATSVEIPAQINNLPVTSIGYYAFGSCTNLESVSVPNSVVSIGNEAFSSCYSLTSITLPNSITSIGDYMFYYCKNLESITIPDSVTSIGTSVFSNCTSLKSITIPNSVISIENNTFNSCTSLESITIPDSVTSIESGAFMNCKSLESIIIPDSVTSIAHSAFDATPWLKAKQAENPLIIVNSILINGEGCEGNVVIPEGVTKIVDNAFSFCRKLESITIPNSVTNIGIEAFKECKSLSNITIPDSVTSIGANAFTLTPWLSAQREQNPIVVVNNILIDGKTCHGEVVIPDGVTSIGDSAFYGCENYIWLEIPDSVTSIGDSAFSESHLGSITIPDSVISIGNNAFYRCRSLSYIALPNSITSIGDYMFSYCTNLNSITISNNITNIGNRAFTACKRLESITIPNSVTNIDECAFSYCESLDSITILNPECKIFDDSATICNDSFDIGDKAIRYSVGDTSNYFNGTIYGYKNSTAQAYAEKYDYKFAVIDDEPNTTEPITTTAVTTSVVTTTTATSITTETYVGDDYDIRWYDKSKTEFHISTAEELDGLRYLVNNGNDMTDKTIYLDNDIYLNDISDYENWSENNSPKNTFEAIGNAEKIRFNGKFDGQNNTIFGLYTKSGGLFGVTDQNAIIQNLSLKNVRSYPYTYTETKYYNDSEDVYEADYAGGICAYNYGTIIKCNVDGFISQSDLSGEYVGGICGSNHEGNIEGCNVSGEIHSIYMTGGICGRNYYGTISDCNVKGNVISSGIYAGGICGYMEENTIISGCHVEGTVSAYGKYSAAGGIIGATNPDLSEYFPKIQYCLFNGSVTGRLYAGGIAGLCNDAIIRECGVTGGTVDVVDGYGNDFSVRHCGAGGICGGIAKRSVIENCYNKADVDCVCHTWDPDIGGIYGNSAMAIGNYEKIKNTYNAGYIKHDYSNCATRGGISGTVYSISDVVYKNCHYLNEITGKGIGSSGDKGTEKLENATSGHSEEEMKTPEFAESLGEAFVYVEGDYPKLAWETGAVPIPPVTEPITTTTTTTTTVTTETTTVTTQTSIIITNTVTTTETKNTISLSKTELTLEIGKSDDISVENYNGSIEWLSSDTSIATVKNGIITAVAAGTVKIYAMTDNGNLICTVTVINKAALQGDISGNGKIDLYDAIEIAKSLIGVRKFTEEEKKIADFNGDGKVDLYDAIAIAKYMLKKS